MQIQKVDARKTFSRIGLAFFAFLGLQQTIATAANVFISTMAPGLTEQGWYIWVVSYAPLYLIGFPVFLLLMRSVPNTVGESNAPAKSKIGVGRLLVLALGCLGVVYPLNMVAVLVNTLVQMLTGYGVSNTLADVMLGSNAIINFVMVVLVAPIMEELIFRGILYKKLAGYGGKVYVFFSAFVFMLYHINLYQMAYAFALGVIFALVTWFTGSIRYSIALHMIVNLVGGGVTPLLYAYASEAAVLVWSVVILLVALVGLVVFIVLAVKYRKQIRFEPGVLERPRLREVLLNIGMILLMVLFVVLLAFAMMSSVAAAPANNLFKISYTETVETETPSQNHGTFTIVEGGDYLVDISASGSDILVRFELQNNAGDVAWELEGGNIWLEGEPAALQPGEYTLIVSYTSYSTEPVDSQIAFAIRH